MPDRLLALAAAAILVVGLFWVRLFQLQVMQGAEHAQAVERALIVVEPLPPRRGRILDRTGTPMAETKPLYHAAAVLAELELEGRARRDQPLWRLDERHLDALAGDLTARLRWINQPQPIRQVILDELSAHPAVALRLGRRQDGGPLALVAVPRRLLTASEGVDQAETTRRLVEGDLLYEDPRDAIAREVAARWGLDAEILAEDGFQAACRQLDTGFALQGERTASVLEPFAEGFTAAIPVSAAPGAAAPELRLRILAAARRDQAVLTLARVIGEEPDLVRERLDRALAGSRSQRWTADLYYAASADGESVAPMLPAAVGLIDIPLPGVPGARERICIIQGDPPDDEGLFTQVCRRLATSLGGIDPLLLQALIEQHAERIRPVTSARDHGVHHLVLDPARLARLVDGLSTRLTALGRPTTALDAERAIAAARRLAERELAGRTRRDPIPLFRDLPHALAVRLAGAGAQNPDSLRRRFDASDAALPGLAVLADVGRSYPYPKSAPHLIGMVARNAESADGSLRGVSGLEQRYDDVLRGVAGGRIRVRTPDGFITMRESPALPGADLVTEVDAELQAIAEDSLDRYIELAHELDPGMGIEAMQAAEKVGRRRGGFALIDCHTGGIIALASNPTFSLEEVRERWDELLKDPAQPLIDHAAVADQPPGSSFKILTALCALENGVMVPGENVWCQGFMAKSGGKPILRDHAPAGTYDLAEAIQISSNVYFAIMADRLGKRLGHGVLPAYAERVGLGRLNALDVPSQRVGRMALPTPDIIASLRPNEPRWYPSDTWRMGIGQFCQAAPLNVAPIAAAVANGGHVVRPFLVRPDSGPVVTDLNIKKAYLDDVQHGMERVTADLPGATARRLVLEGDAAGIKVAAKTGTAEWGNKDPARFPDHAWLIGYAPADRPTVAFACFIHSGTFGGKACVPVAKRVLERYFAKYGKDGHPPAGATP
jgi:penicillin-binding protein 2